MARVSATGFRPAVTAAAFCLLVIHTALADDELSRAFFENNVRPVLEQRCIGCHGPSKSESGLRLDTLESALKGGDSGPALVLGQPDNSLMVQAIRHEGGIAMPPDEQLDQREIDALAAWIQGGASWPVVTRLGGSAPQVRSGTITEEEREFWSFQPIADPEPPRGDGQPVDNMIDHFVNARLGDAHLKPRAAASKRVLIRRATFDLTGLPPTPEDVQSFMNDDSPEAFTKVIDRLLGSRAYGERWGRHWLDVARYADTAGETGDYPTPLSYKYRNWVIGAFNSDMPYDQFVREQIAGDILANQLIDSALKAKSPAHAEHRDPNAEGSCLDDTLLNRYRDMLTATGFIAISRRFGFDVENYHHLTIQDTIDTVGQAVLGLSLGCARCHDHKYDPVNREDYYAWYGIFASTRYSFPGSEEKKRPYDLFPALPPAEAQRKKVKFDADLAAVEAEIQELEARKTRLVAEAQAVVEDVLPVPTDANQLDGAVPKLCDVAASTGDDTRQTPLDRLELQLAALHSAYNAQKATGPYEVVFGAIEQETPTNVQIHIRGEPAKLGDEVPRKNLEILGNDPLPADTGSGRLELAGWLTSQNNPLTARVMVNRIWQHHFGRGLVGTENDFGKRGERPSHPELLDWLASRFLESGYSIKTMHRLIMSSAAYQRSSEFDAMAFEVDPDARLLWRFNRRRLSAEEIRDATLFVSDQLDSSIGGAHPFPPVDTWGFTQHAPYYGVYATQRRSIYLMQQRLKRHPFLALFDGADPNVSTPRREQTTVPTQALYLMNNEFVHQQASALAERVITATSNEAARVEFAFRLTLARPPEPAELADATQFLNRYASALAEDAPSQRDRDLLVWSAFARTMLVRNEFLYVD